jgi:rod shape-determining protein MreB
MFSNFLKKFSKDIGIDLGTSSTLVYVKDKGIIINEPSVVAINTRNDQIIAVGEEAKRMLGKTPSYISVSKPLNQGIISDYEVTEKMLSYFIDKINKEHFSFLFRPRVVISIPVDVTEVERKAVEDATKAAGAREVRLIEQPLAAAIGMRLPIQEPHGQMVVEIGGGTTEIAVISLGGIVTFTSLSIAGNTFNENIMEYARENFNLLIGERTAEDIKIRVGTVMYDSDSKEVIMRGRDLMTGLPKEVLISSLHVKEAISRSVRRIVDAIRTTIEQTPPELVADIYRRGMMLSGGSSLLKGLDRLISAETKIAASIADDPLTAVVRGTGIVVEDLDQLADILLPKTIN